MKTFNSCNIQYQVLRAFYRLASFDMRGALKPKNAVGRADFISCLIVSNRISLLEGLLSDLSCQNLSKKDFEIVIVFDGRHEGVAELIDRFRPDLNINLHQIKEPLRRISDLRNFSVSLSKGEFLLFLDDDTRIFQENFLRLALNIFRGSGCDVLVPQAHPLFGVVFGKYDFLDQFSFTNRCLFLRKDTLQELGGFMKGLQAYEDVELSIRLMINKAKVIFEEKLNYYHPPLYFDSMRKPLAIGQSIFQLRRHYSWLVWLLVYFNALRFLLHGLIPGQRYRHWFKISLGVLLVPFTRKAYYY